MSSPSNLHSAWSRLFVDALAKAGVRRWVVSPGSRSTPLALAVAHMEGLDRHVLLDERSAAFFALGQARATGQPSALLCTSGTACAHYLPAIIEASMSFIPLIVITADRPWELYDSASSQTIDQVKMFGDYVRHYAELGLPDASPASLRAVLRIASQAATRALAPTPGVVHVNARFRKPLEPIDMNEPESWSSDFTSAWEAGPPRVYVPQHVAGESALTDVEDACKRARYGWIVCGPAVCVAGREHRLREAILGFARATGFVLLPEATSGLRFGVDPKGVVVLSFFDALLRVRSFRERCVPELIIEFGAPPVSAGYATLLAERPFIRRYVVAPHGWNDPCGKADVLIQCDVVDFSERMTIRLGAGAARPPVGGGGSSLKDFDASAAEFVAQELREGLLTEGMLARRLVEVLPDDCILVAGTSLPVRHLDRYCPVSEKVIRVLHQRGAAGIDGLVSGAAGSRSTSDVPVVAFVGDLSMQHDLGGLAAARDPRGPLIVVIVQNNGGRIFEHLPIASRAALQETLTDYFITPQDTHFGDAARMFGHAYYRVESLADFCKAMAEGLSRERGTTLIEACVSVEEGSLRRSTATQMLDEQITEKARSLT